MPSADSHRRGRPPVMEPETRRRRVLDAAAAIFAEHGYAEASIEEIARACGMSRKTIYGLYPSKEELLSALLTFFLGPLGMIYTTIFGFLVMAVIVTLVAIVTLGQGLPVVWPLCMIWGVWSGHRYNERQRLLASVRGW